MSIPNQKKKIGTSCVIQYCLRLMKDIVTLKPATAESRFYEERHIKSSIFCHCYSSLVCVEVVVFLFVCLTNKMSVRLH